MDNGQPSIEALLDAQKAYWQQLMHGQDAQSPEQWAEFLSHSQKNLTKEIPQQFSQMLDILGAQSRNFTQYGEELLRQYRDGGEQHINDAVSQFQNYMQQQTGKMLMEQWQLPEQFTSLFKSHSFSDDLLFENPFVSGVKSLLETPVVGGHQEGQQQTREAAKLLIEYQEALHEYVEHYSSINQSAATQMLKQLTSREDKVSSLQQLHDIWVEAYESAYSEKVFTDIYQRSHGRISNALMNLRKFIQDVRDVHFQSVGLATRKGLDTALQRQHRLRKEMRVSGRELQALRDELNELREITSAAGINELKKQVASLRKEVAALKKAANR